MRDPANPEEAEVRNLWNRNAQNWVRGVRHGDDRFRLAFHDPAFFDLLGDVTALSIVDLGCGEGITCRRLLSLGAKSVTGIDISPEMIEAARSLKGPDHTSLNYLTCSASDASPLQSDSYDRAISVMALMDLPDIAQTMKTVKRIVRRGGAFVFSISHPFWDRRDSRWNCSPSGAWQLTPGNYFDERPWIDRWSFKPNDGASPQSEPFEIKSYPRTIAQYLNAAVDADLELVKIVEPQPPQVHDAVLTGILNRWRLIPFYLMARFRV